MSSTTELDKGYFQRELVTLSAKLNEPDMTAEELARYLRKLANRALPPTTAEPLDALDHIMRTARNSRTQTRRLRWIAARAADALGLGPDWRTFKAPKMVDRSKDRVVVLESILRYFRDNTMNGPRLDAFKLMVEGAVGAPPRKLLGSDQILAYVNWHGDPTVGMFGGALTLETGLIGSDDLDEMREDIRQVLVELYSEICGEAVGVVFSDECGECGATFGHEAACPDAPIAESMP